MEKVARAKAAAKLPQIGRQWGKSNKTPDDKALCFKFSKEAGCSDPSCRFAHVCWRCFGKHSFQKCKLLLTRGLLTECTSLPSRPSCPLLPEGGSVAQRAIAAPGKRESAAKADEAVSGDEDELWSNTFSGLEYEEGADGIRFAGLRGTGPPLC